MWLDKKRRRRKFQTEALSENLFKDDPRRMKSKAWWCSTCREKQTFPEPVTIPAPCPRCGGIAFELAHEGD